MVAKGGGLRGGSRCKVSLLFLAVSPHTQPTLLSSKLRHLHAHQLKLKLERRSEVDSVRKNTTGTQHDALNLVLIRNQV